MNPNEIESEALARCARLTDEYTEAMRAAGVAAYVVAFSCDHGENLTGTHTAYGAPPAVGDLLGALLSSTADSTPAASLMAIQDLRKNHPRLPVELALKP